MFPVICRAFCANSTDFVSSYAIRGTHSGGSVAALCYNVATASKPVVFRYVSTTLGGNTRKVTIFAVLNLHSPRIGGRFGTCASDIETIHTTGNKIVGTACPGITRPSPFGRRNVVGLVRRHVRRVVTATTNGRRPTPLTLNRCGRISSCSTAHYCRIMSGGDGAAFSIAFCLCNSIISK